MSLLRPQPKPVKREKPRRPLKRSRPMRRKGSTKHARRKRDFEYMAWISTRPCLARLLAVQGNDCEGRIHVHHAFGRRVVDSDRKTIPLCNSHHREWHGHNGIFEGWDRERRRHWSEWAIEYCQLERQGGIL